METLEERRLLEGTGFGDATAIVLDVNGRGNGPGTLTPSTGTERDFWRFTLSASDFVSVWADTSNSAIPGGQTSAVDTRVRVYDDTFTLLGEGTSNGTLSTGLARDGWFGFVPSIPAGPRTFFVEVLPESTETRAATFPYVLRVRSASRGFDVGGEVTANGRELGIGRELGSLVPDLTAVPPILPQAILGQLGGTDPDVNNRLRQDEIVYRFDVPDRAAYNSLTVISAQVTQDTLLGQRLDTRIDVYNSSGVAVAFDSDTGRLNDAVVTLRTRPGERYFVRVRSDEIRGGNIQLATGPFFLMVDALATQLTLDKIRRTGEVSGAFQGFDAPPDAPNPAMPTPTFQYEVFDFVSEGDGLAIITGQPTGLAPVDDPALRLYGSNGSLLFFNDDRVGVAPQIEARIRGGERYFTMIDGFALPSRTQFTLFVESNHTFQDFPPLDDHPNTTTPANRREFEQATMLTWGPATLTTDEFGNVLKDRGFRTTATATGRIYRPGDTDLFSFVPQVSMLSTYGGNDDNSGTALYVGGRYGAGSPDDLFPTISGALSAWDADDWWAIGRQTVIDAANNYRFGFIDNPATVGTTQAEIYALFSWDPDGTGPGAPILAIGGDFDLIIPNPLGGEIVLRNLAFWSVNPVTGARGWITDVGSTNGPVRAFARFDPAGATEAHLYIGGDFTNIGGDVNPGAVAATRVYAPGTASNFLARVPENGSFAAAAVTGVPRGVRALQVYDPPDPGPAPGPGLPDPPDPPISLFIGTTSTAVSQSILFSMEDSAAVAVPGLISRAPAGGVADAVNALAVYADPDPAPDTTETNVLGVGGRFTFGGQFNLLQFGRAGTFQAIGVGTATEQVNALTVWDPPDINGGTTLPVLVVGGQFTRGAQTNISAFQYQADAFTGAYFGRGTNGPVFALAALAGDTQEPGIEGALRELGTTPNQQTPLYIGGRFTEVRPADPAAPPVLANNTAVWAAQRGLFADFFTWDTLARGRGQAAVSPGGVGVAPGAAADPQAGVFALGAYDDGVQNEWDRHERRATRLSITVSRTDFFTNFLNTQVRVLDSNFNVVYDFGRPGSETINPLGPEPAGMVDQSLAAANADRQLEGITVWAGETYYIEVSGNGEGRYSLSVTADALPPDLNGDGIRDDINGSYTEEADEGRFSASNTRQLRAEDPRVADATNRLETENSSGAPITGGNLRSSFVIPSRLERNWQGMDYGVISTVDDTDLYSFRAEATGTMEIRIGTIGIGGFIRRQPSATQLPGLTTLPEPVGGVFAEGYRAAPGNGLNDGRVVNRIFNSRLDAAIRVFRNDFEQLGYNNDNEVTRGERQAQDVGTYRAFFDGADPRLVVDVVAGNVYYIQVESGQRYIANAEDPVLANRVVNDRTADTRNFIDQRVATGAYQLFINAIGQQDRDLEGGAEVSDDHRNALGAAGGIAVAGTFAATVVAFDERPGSPTGGRASISGVINNTPTNPFDNDAFTFLSPSDGALRITLTRQGAVTTLIPQVFLYDGNGAILQTGATQPDGSVVINENVLRGNRYNLAVFGQGGSEGGYRVDFVVPPVAADYADVAQWWAAQDMTIRDFLGTGSVAASPAGGPVQRLEFPGDTDVFRFRFDTYGTVTANVVSRSSTLDPQVTIYEVSEDLSGNPILLRIGLGLDVSTSDNTASAAFSVAPNRIVNVPAPGVNREYPFYYVVVEGEDLNGDFGDYELSLSFTPSDDHADGRNTAGAVDLFEQSFATQIVVDATTGQGVDTDNRIEFNSDSDLFFFVALATGESRVTFSRPTDSTIRGRVSIVDASGTVLGTSIGADSTSITALQPSVTFNAVRGQAYYIVVDGFDDIAAPNVNTTRTGTYNVTVLTAPIDDHPNATEWTLATVIPIDGATGIGRLGGSALGASGNARLSPARDPNDLFTFTAINNGNVTVRVAAFDTRSPALQAQLTVFRQDGSTFTSLGTVDATGPLAPVELTISGATTGQRYFILVGSASVFGFRDSEYAITITGPTGPTDPPVDDPSVISFPGATPVALSARTGDGTITDRIDVPGDRDLFTFTTTAAGRVSIQVRTPQGSLLDASVRVYSLPNEGQPVGPTSPFDADGIPGTTGSVSFLAGAATQYWILVDGLGDSTGSYIVDINTTPVTNFLYFPEGFATTAIREFVSIVNPNNAPASYTMYLRYEFGSLETVVASRTIPANSRGGETIIDTTLNSIPGLRLGVPYSIIIESDLPLGATLAHYDFGSAIGEGFTERVSSTHAFARVERNPGNVLNFMVLYNPNPFDIEVTLSATGADGATVNVVRTVGALRRGGFAINDMAELPLGVFGAVLTSRAASPANQANFIGIVASLSHFEPTNDAGFAYMADPIGGSTSGVVTNVSRGAGLASEAVFFNPGNEVATVTLTTRYVREVLPPFQRTFSIQPRQRIVFRGEDLGILPDQPVGLRYNSDRPVSVVSFERQNGDANGVAFSTEAATRLYFGDAFINRPQAGTLYFETIFLYNPSAISAEVSITLFFAEGIAETVPASSPNFALRNRTFTVTVGPRAFAEVKLHERPEITQRPQDFNFFSVDVNSPAVPINATMVHYDLLLGGGWATAGVPFGLINNLSRIP